MAAPLAGKFSDRRGPRAIITLSIVLVAISFVVFGLSGGEHCRARGRRDHPRCRRAGRADSNQSRIYALSPDARSRVNTVYMVTYFIGGAAGSAVGAAVWPVFGWAGVSVAGIVFAGLRRGIIWRFPRARTASAVVARSAYLLLRADAYSCNASITRSNSNDLS